MNEGQEKTEDMQIVLNNNNDNNDNQTLISNQTIVAVEKHLNETGFQLPMDDDSLRDHLKNFFKRFNGKFKHVDLNDLIQRLKQKNAERERERAVQKTLAIKSAVEGICQAGNALNWSDEKIASMISAATIKIASDFDANYRVVLNNSNAEIHSSKAFFFK